MTALALVACSSRPCREPRDPSLDQTQARSGLAKAALSSAPEDKSRGLSAGADTNAPLRSRVYKPDGSRQCEKRGGNSVELVERELAGIPVYQREKRSDGLMHIQVCGSPTGMINIYEIDSSNLKKAEERGFKKWEEGR
jgi:hypothetical protein